MPRPRDFWVNAMVDVRTGAEEGHSKSMSLKGPAKWTVQAQDPQFASRDDMKWHEQVLQPKQPSLQHASNPNVTWSKAH